MKDYRWPGYAVEDGELYETAGGHEDGVQRWRRIDRLHMLGLRGLLESLEKNGEKAFDGMPSDGIILKEEDE